MREIVDAGLNYMPVCGVLGWVSRKERVSENENEIGKCVCVVACVGLSMCVSVCACVPVCVNGGSRRRSQQKNRWWRNSGLERSFSHNEESCESQIVCFDSGWQIRHADNTCSVTSHPYLKLRQVKMKPILWNSHFQINIFVMLIAWRYSAEHNATLQLTLFRQLIWFYRDSFHSWRSIQININRIMSSHATILLNFSFNIANALRC